MLLLEVSQRRVRNGREAESKLKSHIATVRCTAAQLSNWPHEPDLCHAENSAHDTEQESSDGGNSGWELVLVEVVLWLVAGEATAVEDVLGEGDAFVDGEPISNDQHEVFQDRLEVGIAWDGDGDVDTCSDKGPDESWDALGDTGKKL